MILLDGAFGLPDAAMFVAELAACVWRGEFRDRLEPGPEMRIPQVPA
ncbi:MAG: hypothetical protein IT452_00130 [Planctomycetia bacterium]|nr:hypothetical protein [Planctomycetia bacterium]